jgi:hypothetical protein
MKTADELKDFFIVRYGQKNWSMQVQDTNAVIPLLWAQRHGRSKPIPFYEVSKACRERIKDLICGLQTALVYALPYCRISYQAPDKPVLIFNIPLMRDTCSQPLFIDPKAHLRKLCDALHRELRRILRSNEASAPTGAVKESVYDQRAVMLQELFRRSKELHMSRSELARKTGLNYLTIQRVLDNENNTDVRMNSLCLIANALGYRLKLERIDNEYN